MVEHFTLLGKSAPDGAAPRGPQTVAALAAAAHFDDGAFARDLARRVAIRTESQDPRGRRAARLPKVDELGASLGGWAFAAGLRQPAAGAGAACC